MSAFITPLRVELIDDDANEFRGAWRLTGPLTYKSSTARKTFVVPAGFVTDFESCPRLLVLFWLFGELAHEAAVVHDWLYSPPAPVTRRKADAVLREACIVSGIPAWRAWGIWLGVRLGGAAHYNRP